MRQLGNSSEDEMILAFLRAEAYSPRFKGLLRDALGGDLSLVYTARLNEPSDNLKRHAALTAYRGYGSRTLLFGGFPGKVDWRRVALSRADLGALLYANYPTWVELSGGSRLVRDGALNVGRLSVEDIHTNVAEVEEGIRTGRIYPEPILAAESSSSTHVVVEGHTRVTALYRSLEEDAEIEAIVGYSDHMSEWIFH